LSAVLVDSDCQPLSPADLLVVYEQLVQPEDTHQQHKKEWNRNQSCLPTGIQD
jgi:hypothetical protein